MSAIDRAARDVTFPLYPINPDGTCSCGQAKCLSNPRTAGKHPSVEGWLNLPAGGGYVGTSERGAGIATGSVSDDLVVVDLDGPEAVAWAAGRFPPTYAVKTGNGFHLYFKGPGWRVRKSIKELAPGVDIIAEGGYVVAPGSPHRSGCTYAIVHDGPRAPLPAWLLEWPGLRAKETRAGTSEPGECAPTPIDLDTVEGKSVLREATTFCATAPEAIEGQNGSGALWSVCLELVRRRALPDEASLDLIMTVYNPRCRPPWDEADVIRKIEEVRDKSDLGARGISDEAWDALCAKLRSTSRGLRPGVTPTQKIPTSSPHTYTFVAGSSTTMGVGASARALSDIANILSTADAWQGVLAWDTLRKQVVAVNPPVKLDCEQTGADLSEGDVLAIRMWLECHGTLLSGGEARGIIEKVASMLPFDPIVNYLESCATERVPGILDNAAEKLFGNAEPISQKWFKQFMVGCARRGLRPGTKHDEALILYGSQSFKKSTFVEMLFGAEYTLMQKLDLEDVRKTGEFLKCAWGAELGELNSLNKSSLETVKHFLTMTVDEYQPPYGRRNVRNPRRTCFVGTTNAPQFLNDPTGGRRFLVVEVMRKIDLEWLRANLSALWGEAMYYAKLPTSLERPDLAGTDRVFDHWDEDLTAANVAREAFTVEDEWFEVIHDFLVGKKNVTAAEVYVGALDGKAKEMSTREGDRIRNVLAAIGCTPAKRTKARRGFDVPARLADRIPTEPSRFTGASGARLAKVRDEADAVRSARRVG